MKNRLLIMAVFCLSVLGAQAQQQEQLKQQEEDNLTEIMSEREQLIMEYQYLNQQNSNFWGKKSKQDLMSIIETLKKIINKDTELVAAVKEATIKRVAASTVDQQRAVKITVEDKRNIDAQINDLKGQIKTLQTNSKKRERIIKDLEAELKGADDIRYGKDKVISVLAVVSFILLLYAVFLQVRLNNSKVAPKKKVVRKKA
ncbi:hypothetical protein [Pontibacter harenae]|uniref:hypothetical protein n=1 Tax=Pontibacter harenae TaxID=2894083 RepID=UPI001E5348FD|nr:hypothetical protein [Pontibacter harenae]MCC9167031.1 hypothetical protein [Pontibacter harenae]